MGTRTDSTIISELWRTRAIFLHQLPAIFCAVALAVCLLIAHPAAETSMNDEWSYAFSAQRLADTGHITYNGWAAPIQGWLMVVGALVIKLFGLSYACLRLAVLVISMVTAYLLQRCLVHLGIHAWNATLGTLAVVLSPLFVPLAFTYMTDMPGIFCLVLCLYSCLRALHATAYATALRWLAFAGIGNMLDGIVRQTAWLGILVLVPSTIWIMRRRRGALVLGIALWLTGLVVVACCMRWFLRQPYSVREPIFEGRLTFGAIVPFLSLVVQNSLAICLYLSPVLCGFAVHFPFRNKPAVRWLAGCLVTLPLILAGAHLARLNLRPYLAPFSWNYVTDRGLLDGFEIQGTRPVVLNLGTRLAITTVVAFVTICFAVFLFLSPGTGRPMRGSASTLAWEKVIVLLGPVTVAYLLLLVPRAALRGILFDRYLVPLILLLLPIPLRLYQERVSERLPVVSLGMILLIASFSVVGMHDLFALYRAKLEAIHEIRLAGVPRTSIQGGWDYDGWTQLEADGYVNEPRLTIPEGAYKPPQRGDRSQICGDKFYTYLPAVHGLYTLAYDPAACLGASAFPPVSFKTWFAPHHQIIYVVRMK